MKKLSIFLCLIIFLNLNNVYAEKIFCKDGRVINNIILYRNKESVWVKHPSGSIGIPVESILKIENEDGSLSRFDLNSILQGIIIYIKQHDYEKAAGYCSLLLELFPDDGQIYYLRGLLYQKCGNLSGAISDYKYLINHKHADAGVFNNLGVIYANDKDAKEALELFQQAVLKSPDVSEIHNNLADLLLENKEYKLAIEQYLEVLSRDGNNVSVLYNLGLSYMHDNNYSKAKEVWERALEINPQDKDLSSAINYLELKKNQ